MEPIPRPGIYTPIIPVGMAPSQLIMDMAPSEHSTGLHVSNISSTQKRQIWRELSVKMTCGLLLMVVLLGSVTSQVTGLCFVSLVTKSLGESVLHQSERALGRLMLITAIHHVGRTLPPHVCYDLFLGSRVTVRDEGPCGRAAPCHGDQRHKAEAPGPSTELRALAAGPSTELRVTARKEAAQWGVGRIWPAG